MSLARLRRGELVVLAGLVGLVATLFLRWFDFEGVKDPTPAVSFFGTTDTGWRYLGGPWTVVLLLVALAAVVALVTAARSGAGRPTYGAVTAVVVGVLVAAVGLLLLAVRVLLATPTPALDDLGSSSILSTLATTDSRPDPSRLEADLSPAIGAWVALASLLAILVGLWLAMADDRTRAAESVAVVPPQPRVVPPLRWTPPAPAAPASPDDAATPADPAAGVGDPTAGPADAARPAGDPAEGPARPVAGAGDGPWTPSPESPVPPDADEGTGPARPPTPGSA